MAIKPKVGFYGCNVLDGTVRVGLAGEVPDTKPGAHSKYPQYAVADCPCGNRHLIRIAWRLLNKGEEVAPDIWIERGESQKGVSRPKLRKPSALSNTR